MAKIKAILFDMDGVLIDAREWHFEALNQALSLFGMEISPDEHLLSYDGLPTKTKLEMITLERGLPRALHHFINDLKQSFTLQLGHLKCRPNFIHQYALSGLKSRGYKLVSCSNSIRRTMELFYEKAGLIQFFDFYLSNEDVKNPKPSPEIYIEAIERLGCLPDECLILEDNENGIRAAEGSGAHLMVIDDINQVTLDNILKKISSIEGAS